MRKIIVVIVVVVVVVSIGAASGLAYFKFNDHSSSMIDNLLSLLVGNNLARRNFALNNEVFQIGRMGMPIPANARDFTLLELFNRVEKSVVQINGRNDPIDSRLARGLARGLYMMSMDILLQMITWLKVPVILMSHS